ncbi:MAG: hypothetical protein MJ187_03640 [Alphaproteobacteria bacterium]|nr:hypothetical protein [Alphaproteobacteria bacterium]
MKRITLALLSVFLITPCFANIHISSNGVEITVKQKISGADAQVAALAEYNAQIKNAGGTNAGIPASGVWQVCKAAGWDITKPDGESKCQDFVNALMKYATWKFRALCGEDNIFVKNGFGRCIDDVFSNKVLGGTKVNQLIANGLAKEYARIKFADNNLACSKKIRQTTLPPDDYIQCLSMDKNMAYEFRFDSVTETTDYVINEGTESGVCKIFGLKYSPSGYSNAATLGNGQTVGTSETWKAACETTDGAICSKVNESMSRFGRSAKIGTTGSKSNKHTACVISNGSVSASNLRTAFGINNYAFKESGIQLNSNVATQTQVCDWVKKTVTNPKITSCKCNDGFTQLYDFSGMIPEVDDVLTCTINGQPVDFVFDDLSESNKKVAKGGAQGMDCMAAGGTYAGEQCINLDEKQCKLLASANLKNCPTCKRVKYQNGVCMLPSGADAENVQKNTNIALIIGGAVVGVTVTVATGGAGAVVVLTGIETVGAAIELGAQLKIDAIADEFLVQSNNCKSASCAKNLIKNNFQHLADSQNDFTTPEISAIDSEMARLANLIPENDDFWSDVALNSLSMSDNQSGIFENWTPEQVWRAVGITLQMASVVTSVGKWIGPKAKTAVTKLSKSSKVLMDKTDDVVKAVAQTSDDVRLSAKRTQLKQKISEGKPIRLSSGEEITIPKVQFEANFYGYKVEALGDSNGIFVGVKPDGFMETRLFDAPSQYPRINELEDYLKHMGGDLNVFLNNQAEAVYTFGVQDGYLSHFEDVLKEKQIPFNRQGNQFLIYESELARTFPEYAMKENPIITHIVNEVGDGAMDRARTVKELDDIVDKKQIYSNALVGAVDQKQLERYAQDTYDTYVDIIARDQELARQAINFDNLSLEEKRQFAAELSARYDGRKGCNGLVCNYDKTLDTAPGNHSQGTNVLDLNPNVMSDISLDEFLGTVAHENNHYLDEIGKGALNSRQTVLSNAVNGVSSRAGIGDLANELPYRSHLTEQSSWAVTEVFEGNGSEKIVNDILDRMLKLGLD